MSTTRRFERALGVDRLRLLADACLAALTLGALWLMHATGLPLVGIAAFVLAATAVETVVSGRVRDAILDAVEDDGAVADVAGEDATGAAPGGGDSTAGLVAEVADAMGLARPTVVTDGTGAWGITVFEGRGSPTVLVAQRFLADLDREAARGVVAHELAHVDLGHLGRLSYREPAAHVVGFAVTWALVLHALPPHVVIVLAAVYLFAGATHPNALLSLTYLLSSLGVVLVPIALGAYAGRLEELAADDRAAALVGPDAYCRGLYRCAAATDVQDDLVGDRPFAGRRGPLARLTAGHPTVERRLARFGFSVADFG
ncbi:MAG: M48 family metalloprotease [Haloarculaceae archaeon]